MTFAEQFLVITLSAFLAIFLILAIIVLVKVNQVMDHVKNIISKAEHIADQAEHVTSFFHKTAGPVAASRIIAGIISSIKQAKSHKEK
ncbi:MAG: hypothetical protein ACXWLH_02955 [Candidatus Saccharimonadales bacterium]